MLFFNFKNLRSTLTYINIHSHHLGSQNDFTIINKHHDFLKFIDSSYYSIGLHPWYIKENSFQEELVIVEDVAKNKNILAMGECGLDRLCSTNWELQKKVFISQIKIAEQLNKPIIIHCVKAFDELIKIKKELNIKLPLIVHGYNNNQQIASELVKNGFYFSFGKALLKADSNASSIISTIPLDRIFLETDDADVSIKAIFEAASRLLQLNELELINIIHNNFKTVFHYERP